MRAEELAQPVKCFLCQQEDLGSIPTIVFEKLSIAVYAPWSHTGEVETRGLPSLVASWSSSVGKLQTVEKFCVTKVNDYQPRLTCPTQTHTQTTHTDTLTQGNKILA